MKGREERISRVTCFAVAIPMFSTRTREFPKALITSTLSKPRRLSELTLVAMLHYYGQILVFTTEREMISKSIPHRHRTGSQARGGAKSYVANGKMAGGFAVVASPVSRTELTLLITENHFHEEAYRYHSHTLHNLGVCRSCAYPRIYR
jgi:DUF2950 family protein